MLSDISKTQLVFPMRRPRPQKRTSIAGELSVRGPGKKDGKKEKKSDQHHFIHDCLLFMREITIPRLVDALHLWVNPRPNHPPNRICLELSQLTVWKGNSARTGPAAPLRQSALATGSRIGRGVQVLLAEIDVLERVFPSVAAPGFAWRIRGERGGRQGGGAEQGSDDS